MILIIERYIKETNKEENKMNKVVIVLFVLAMAFGFIACGEQAETEKAAQQPEKPTVAELHAYKAYHHARYMVQTAA